MKQDVSTMKRYVKRVFRASSILFNVILGGMDDQTFAARNWVRHKRGKVNLVRVLDYVYGPDHCVSEWVDWSLSKLRDKDYEVL
jgi:hypothetical protein